MPSAEDIPYTELHIAGDRLQEKKFREWLAKCHSQLDKSLRFENLADSTVQARYSSNYFCTD